MNSNKKLSLDWLSPMYSSHYHYEAPSFKQKIIQKIVVSVKHYLREGNIENSEAGLVTLLRITGAITENISEVRFLIPVRFFYRLIGVFFLSSAQVPVKFHFNCGICK